ncbi:MAG: hypothetical protein K2Y39_19620 [Candidatus Obscuribacterales bacterium]|nr:hypothetical protein [Candidatus Obscuribacterales bacterium]
MVSMICKQNVGRKAVVCLAAFAFSFLSVGETLAQNNSSRQSKPASTNEEHQVERLREKVDLPDLPAYTGKAKFVSGSVEQSSKGGPRYAMVFEAQEPEGQVLDWYEGVFRMYKWGRISRTGSSIAASHKDGHYASIQSDQVIRRDGKSRSSFTVHYKMAVR